MTFDLDHFLSPSGQYEKIKAEIRGVGIRYEMPWWAHQGKLLCDAIEELRKMVGEKASTKVKTD